MTTDEIIKGLKNAIERFDGTLMASLFVENGVYHDVFYGAFEGKARIKELVEVHVRRTCRDTRWDFFSPVSDGRNLCAPYVFSYISSLPGANTHRVGFEGVSILRLEGGLVESYREIANTGPTLLDIGFPPERVAKILNKQNAGLQARPESASHWK